MLKYRIMTALCLIPLVLMGIFYLPNLEFAGCTAAIFLLAQDEWLNLIGVKNIVVKISGLLLAAVLMFLSTLQPKVVLLLSILWWCIAIFLLLNYPKSMSWWSHFASLRWLVGYWIIVPAWLSIVIIHRLPHGSTLLLFLLLLIWGADTGAYFAGRLWGKQKLAAKISPGKTMEGVVGGFMTDIVVLTIGIMMLADQLFHQAKFALIFFFLGMMIVVISVVGDLTESMFKRQQNVKDSGTLLPGHGGLLDRIDSLLAAAPFFALGVWWLFERMSE